VFPFRLNRLESGFIGFAFIRLRAQRLVVLVTAERAQAIRDANFIPPGSAPRT
jgi:hypothetical protein